MMDVSWSTISGRRCGGTTSWISATVNAWFGCGEAGGVCASVLVWVFWCQCASVTHPPCARGEVSTEERERVDAMFGMWDGEDEIERAWGIVQRDAGEGAFGEVRERLGAGVEDG